MATRNDITPIKENLSGRPYKWGERTIHMSLRMPKSIKEKIDLKARRESVSFNEALNSLLINVRNFI
jgi:predicted HicB family RNase H-like nuclease